MSDTSMAPVRWPVREKSANGVPAPKTSIERRCKRCGASFLGCQGGTSGEVGIWRDWRWFCSRECFDRPEDVAAPGRCSSLPDQCVSAITVGQTLYWCQKGAAGHDGMCGGSDQWGGNVEWRFWRVR